MYYVLLTCPRSSGLFRRICHRFCDCLLQHIVEYLTKLKFFCYWFAGEVNKVSINYNTISSFRKQDLELDSGQSCLNCRFIIQSKQKSGLKLQGLK